jgi:hypothetical protein
VTEAEWRAARTRCLELVAGFAASDPRGTAAAAKIVVSGGHEPRAFQPLLDAVADVAPEVPVVLQPVTPMRGVATPDRELLLALVELALDRSLALRVVPQVHRVLRLP